MFRIKEKKYKIMKKKILDAELGGLLPKVCCDQGARQLGRWDPGRWGAGGSRAAGACGWARGRGARLGERQGRVAGRMGPAERSGHDRLGGTGARPRCAAGPVGCALVALSLF